MDNELAILIWMTNPANIRVVSRLLAQSGFAFRVCENIEEVAEELDEGRGALLLEEETLTSPSVLSVLNESLDNQPPWSDLPVVLLIKKRKANGNWSRLIRNLTLLERPVSSTSLVSILETALQLRRRQYEVRNLLAHLEKLNRNLEQRVAERTEELQRRVEKEESLVAELSRSNQELEQFAYIASHDLKSPLRTISGFLELLSRRYKGQLTPEADEFISFAVEGAARMHDLINDILAFSRVGTRGAQLTALDSRIPLEMALKQLQVEKEKSGARISFTGLPEVCGDLDQLVQVFQNLVGNAIKYRKAGRPPSVHIAAEEKQNEWEFQVRDNGIGLESQYAEQIFQIFKRLHSEKEYSGTGIGLAICKKIVERHGGRIWVESEPGKGSTFFFTLAKP